MSRFAISDSTVHDTTTGLTWQREVPPGRYSHAEALAYAASLKLAGGGWRLPTVAELVSIVDLSRYNPAIDEEAFPNTPSDWFWSATPLAGGSSSAWYVNFSSGYVNNYDVTYTIRVRCVR